MFLLCKNPRLSPFGRAGGLALRGKQEVTLKIVLPTPAPAADAEPSGRKNRGGRPRSESPRNQQVMVRLTAEEKALLLERAGPRGISEWLRAHGLGRKPRTARQVPELNREAWQDLAHCLGNLNQIARHLNEGGHVEVGRIERLIAEIRTQVHGLRLALLGQLDSEDPDDGGSHDREAP